MQVILLERVEKLGPDGRRSPRQGRLRPQLPAAQEEGPARHQGELTYFESQRKVLEAQNLERRSEAEAAAGKRRTGRSL